MKLYTKIWPVLSWLTVEFFGLRPKNIVEHWSNRWKMANYGLKMFKIDWKFTKFRRVGLIYNVNCREFTKPPRSTWGKNVEKWGSLVQNAQNIPIFCVNRPKMFFYTTRVVPSKKLLWITSWSCWMHTNCQKISCSRLLYI